MPPPEDPAAIAIALLVVVVSTSLLLLNRERVRRIVATHVHRRELRRIAERELPSNGGDGGGDGADADAAGGGRPRQGRPVVSALYVHPVKSCRAVSVSSSSVTNLGLEGDRRLMVVRPGPGSNEDGDGGAAAAATHRFVTQRQCPSLATVVASLPTVTSGGRVLIKLSRGGGDGPSSSDDDGKNSDDGPDEGGPADDSAASAASASVHVDVTPSTLASLPVRYRAGIWDQTVTVVDVGDGAAEFVRSIVAADPETDVRTYGNVRVVAMAPPGGSGSGGGGGSRTLDGRYLPPAAFTAWGSVPRTSLNDGFPLLVACESSLEELNRRLVEGGKDPVPMSRFRPNVVIRGTEPFEEDSWKAILIGGRDGRGTILHVVKGCPRCKQSCTDQITGERGSEPLETLSTFRALGTSGSDVYFAQNAVLQGSAGTVSVGDEVVVLTRGDPVWDRDTVKAE